MVELAGVQVEGISIGGIETCIEVPEWKLAFDVGRCRASAVRRRTILFTHAHVDHMGGVVMHAATRALLGMPPPRYVVPRVDADAFRRMFVAWRALDRSDLEHELIEVAPREEVRLARDLVARPFSSPHRAPCQGYVLYREKAKLLPQYRGLAGADIARLRAGGTEVTEVRRTPELAFTGDSRIDVLEREEDVRRARRLVLEVTFLDDRVDVASTRAMGHVHLDEVVERAELFENEAILLTHFSARYKRSEIVSLLDAKLPRGLRERVTPLLEGWEA